MRSHKIADLVADQKPSLTLKQVIQFKCTTRFDHLGKYIDSWQIVEL
jgi:hypothetical protein